MLFKINIYVKVIQHYKRDTTKRHLVYQKCGYKDKNKRQQNKQQVQEWYKRQTNSKNLFYDNDNSHLTIIHENKKQREQHKAIIILLS